MKNRENILIRTSNWLGDCILNIPAIKVLRKYTDSRITLLVPLPYKELFEIQEFVDEVIGWDRKKVSLVQLSKKIARMKINIGILLPNSFSSALLFFLAGIPKRVGYSTDFRGFLLTDRFKRPKWYKQKHEVFYYLHLVKKFLNIDTLEEENFPDITIKISDKKVKEVINKFQLFYLRRPIIGVFPGAAYGEVKRWNRDKFARLIKKLIKELKCTVILMGTTEEKKICNEIRIMSSPEVINLAGQTSIIETTAIVKNSDIILSNDSGPMHLAAALRKKQIALFGSTRPELTGPLSPLAKILRPPSGTCQGCKKNKCIYSIQYCFESIQEERVYEAVIEVLNN